MKLTSSLTARVAAAITTVLLCVTASPANADSLSTDPNGPALQTAITAATNNITTATSMSLTMSVINIDPAAGSDQGIADIVITPTVSEMKVAFSSSTDSGATWVEDTSRAQDVITTSGTVYTRLNAGKTWTRSNMVRNLDQVKSSGHITADWATAPEASVTAGDPNVQIPKQQVSSISTILTLPLGVFDLLDPTHAINFTLSTDNNGNTVYSKTATSMGESLTVTYTVTPDGALHAMSYATTNGSAYETVVLTLNGFGDANVTTPVFDTTKIAAVPVATLYKSMDVMTVHENLTVTANKITKTAKKTATKAHRKVSVKDLEAGAKKSLGTARVKSIRNGVRLSGTLNKAVGYVCMTVARGTVTTKNC
jgi:hypothetical protein